MIKGAHFPIDGFIISETALLQDQRTHKEWHQLLSEVSKHITDTAQKEELKKLENMMRLLQLLQKNNSDDNLRNLVREAGVKMELILEVYNPHNLYKLEAVS